MFQSHSCACRGSIPGNRAPLVFRCILELSLCCLLRTHWRHLSNYSRVATSTTARNIVRCIFLALLDCQNMSCLSRLGIRIHVIEYAPHRSMFWSMLTIGSNSTNRLAHKKTFPGLVQHIGRANCKHVVSFLSQCRRRSNTDSTASSGPIPGMAEVDRVGKRRRFLCIHQRHQVAPHRVR